MLVRLTAALLVATLLALGAFAAWPASEIADVAKVRRVAENWVGSGESQPPRRAGDEWEVDVVRPDGSLIEVTIGDDLRLLGLDEELGPGRSAAHDEVTGPGRLRAAAAALAVVPGGAVLAVEQEQRGIEVAVRGRDGGRLEVAMDARHQVTEIEAEDSEDE